VAPGVVHYTGELLFRDLWLRPALTPRDRSLVNGLTKAQASEVLTQLAFYAGWPNVFSAIPIVKSVFEKRS